MSDILLSAKNLTKRFGGLAAVDNVSIDLQRNHIQGIGSEPVGQLRQAHA